MITLRAVALAACLLATLAFVSPVFAQQADELQEATRLMKQGQLAQAMDRVDRYLRTRPKDARGRFLKGLILTEQKKAAEAINVFTALTQDYPELPEPYNNLAVLYASQGQYDKAQTALQMAIRTHPSYATAHENLGDIYAKMASQAYDKALQLDRNNPTAQTKLALIQELFSSSPRPAKASSLKPEPGPKVASASPTPAKPAATVAPAPSKPAATATSEPARAAPSAPAAKPAVDETGEISKAVNHWAQAWSANDVGGYLSSYAADFKTPNGEPRSKWEATRKARIAKPRTIQVTIESLRVRLDGSQRATVTFRQHYRSGTLKVSSTKTLIMVKSGNKWLIQQERVGS
ncbi:MAG: tetratricopeptide repeat protein [Betaproteobacteria bacterium]|nr:tetratricopeptide repeat protein [Betaproteobacteria bacterium]